MPGPAARRRLLTGLAVAAAVALLYAGLAAAVGVGDLAAALRAVRPGAVLAALGLVVVTYSVRSARWGLYLHGLGALAPRGPFGLGRAFAMGLPQGKWGQVAKAWALRTRADTPYERAVPAILAERASDIVGEALHLALGLALVPAPHARGLAVGVLLLLGALLALRSGTVAAAVLAMLRWAPWVRRHETALLDGHHRLRAHLDPAALALPAAFALVAFLAESAVLWVLAAGLGAPIPFAQAVVVVALVNIAGTLSFLPGGFGAAEGSLVVLLALAGVPLAQAAALTVLYRATTLGFGILLGALGVLVLRASPRARAAAA